MSIETTNLAIRILSIWYGTWDEYKLYKSAMFKRFAIRQRAIGIINHDRVLLGRRLLIPTIKTRF